MTLEALEAKVSTDDIKSILHKAWEIAHMFGDRGNGADSFPTYQVYSRHSLEIDLIYCTDFCGVTNGHLEIKHHGEKVFYFDYGEAASEGQFGGVPQDKIYTAGTKLNALDEKIRDELSFLYDLSCKAKSYFEQLVMKRAEREARQKHLLSGKN